MNLLRLDVVIKRHVFGRAMQRGIHPDMIKDALRKGKMQRFGKQGIDFINIGSKKTFMYVGELIRNN